MSAELCYCLGMKLTDLPSKLVHTIANGRAFRRGQVTLQSDIGKWIKLICSLTEVKSIVDVGTWSGAGTTKCAVDGVLAKSDSRNLTRITGIELNPVFAKKAAKRFSRHQFVEILNGSLVPASDLDVAQLSPEEEAWLEQDRSLLARAPLQLDKMPVEIDCLILDGGEFSTLPEFLVLRSKVRRWIVLDDVFTRKNREVKRLLLEDPEYSLVFLSEERNGTAVFLKSFAD